MRHTITVLFLHGVEVSPPYVTRRVGVWSRALDCGLVSEDLMLSHPLLLLKPVECHDPLRYLSCLELLDFWRIQNVHESNKNKFLMW